MADTDWERRKLLAVRSCVVLRLRVPGHKLPEGERDFRCYARVNRSGFIGGSILQVE